MKYLKCVNGHYVSIRDVSFFWIEKNKEDCIWRIRAATRSFDNGIVLSTHETENDAKVALEKLIAKLEA
jgi:hypothetical protein